MRAAIFGLLIMTSGAAAAAQQDISSDDPYLWLEDVSGQRAMDWVNSHNARSQAVLEADPRYQQYYNDALAIAQAKDRIPYGSLIGGKVYNFWQDADHVRGIWRRASLESYAGGIPNGRRCSTSTRSLPPRRRTGCGRARNARVPPSAGA